MSEQGEIGEPQVRSEPAGEVLSPVPVEPSSEKHDTPEETREFLNRRIADLPEEEDRDEIRREAAERADVSPEVVDEALEQPASEDDEYVDERSVDSPEDTLLLEEQQAEQQRLSEAVENVETSTPGTPEHARAVSAAERILQSYNATGNEKLRRWAAIGGKSLFVAVAISLLLSLLLFRLHTSAGNKGGR
jgi:hypothetical protein